MRGRDDGADGTDAVVTAAVVDAADVIALNPMSNTFNDENIDVVVPAACGCGCG